MALAKIRFFAERDAYFGRFFQFTKQTLQCFEFHPMKKISENPSSKELADGIKGFEALAKVAGWIPFVRSSETYKNLVSRLQDLKAQSEILELPDRFNEKFSEVGWIAYESMNVEMMKRGIRIGETEEIEERQKLLFALCNLIWPAPVAITPA